MQKPAPAKPQARVSLREHSWRRLQVLKAERSTWLPHWRDLTYYIAPWEGRFIPTDRNKGYKRTWAIINNKAVIALRTLQAGMLSGFTSQARPWFKLSTHDPEMMKSAGVRSWCETVEDILRFVFSQSNTYKILSKMYAQLGLFGTATSLLEEDDEDTIRLYPSPMGQFMIAQSHRQVVDTVYREYSLTVGQAVQMFGINNVSPYVQNAYNNCDYDFWVWFVHATEPNMDRLEGQMGADGMPVRSCWFETGIAGYSGAVTDFGGYTGDTLKVNKVGGYEEFPYLCPRWDTTAEDVYGHCPGMEALPDTRALQTLERRKAQVVDKIVNPPMGAPTTLRAQRASVLPGDITYLDTISGSQKYEPLYQVNPNAVQVVEDSIAKHEGRIDEAFYAQLWLLIANEGESDPQKTAREIAEMHEEKLLQLGPVVENVNGELAAPLVRRTFRVCARRGMLPPPPPEILGKPLRIDFVSIMAQAQKMLGLQSVHQLIGDATSLAQIRPDAVDKLNPDAILEHVRDLSGAPADLLLTDEQVKKVRDDRAKAQAQQQQAEQAAAAAKGAKDLAGADMGGDNGLTRLVQGLGGPAAGVAGGQAAA